MREIALGQYYPTKSVLHRLDPRVKLVIMIAYVVCIFFIRSFFAYGVTAACLLVVILISRVPLGKVLASLKTILFLVIFTVIMTILFYGGKPENLLWQWGIIRIYSTGLINAGKMACRLILLVLGPTMLTFTTTPVELTDGLESLLKPLTLVRFPVHQLAIIMSIALRLIPTLVEETDKITAAESALRRFRFGQYFQARKSNDSRNYPAFRVLVPSRGRTRVRNGQPLLSRRKGQNAHEKTEIPFPRRGCARSVRDFLFRNFMAAL